MIYVLRYALVALYTVFWSSVASLVALVDRRGDAHTWIARRWVGWILGSCRVRVEVSGLEKLDPERPCVWMSNHQSVFDVAAIFSTLPVRLRFVAKRELTWIPFFGWAIRLGGHVIVDRRNRQASVESLARAARRVASGTHVIIFPEGTRSPTGELRDFKSGGFHLALAAQVPVVPVTVSGSRAITPARSLRIESGLIHVHYGEPIPTRGLSDDDREALKRRVADAIRAGFHPALQGGAGPPAARASASRAI